MNLTVIYITARPHCEVRWFIDSLCLQLTESVQVIIVDFHAAKRPMLVPSRHKTLMIRHVAPKPTVWQGPSRVTREDWWAAANARNTGLCLTTTKWVAFLDDRCVVLPGWEKAIQEAMDGNYALAGAYEKRTGVTVEGGIIQHAGIVIGEDTREKYFHEYCKKTEPFPCDGAWLFGCALMLATDWAFKVNGYDETCDGLGMEDVIFGMHLSNSGFPIKYDPRLKIIEDRTPEKIANVPGKHPRVMRHEDKGVSPQDKSHALLAVLKDLKQAKHPINLSEIRQQVLSGHPFPPPWGPVKDWYDEQPIKDF